MSIHQLQYFPLFYATNGVFDHDTHLAEMSVVCFVFSRQWGSSGCKTFDNGNIPSAIKKEASITQNAECFAFKPSSETQFVPVGLVMGPHTYWTEEDDFTI